MRYAAMAHNATRHTVHAWHIDLHPIWHQRGQASSANPQRYFHGNSARLDKQPGQQASG
jgi:hypothetical protein